MFDSVRKWWRERRCRKNGHAWARISDSEYQCCDCKIRRNRDITDITREAFEVCFAARQPIINEWLANRDWVLPEGKGNTTIKIKHPWTGE